MKTLPAGLGLAADVPARMTLNHPITGVALVNGKTGEPAWIELYSSDSRAVKKVDNLIGNRRIAEARRKGGKVNMTMEQVQAEQVERLVAATAGWDLCDLEGNPVTGFPCTPENVKALYEAPEFAWIEDQVRSFIEDRANFSKASSTS